MVTIESSAESPSQTNLTSQNNAQSVVAVAFKLHVETINTSCVFLTFGEDIKLTLHNDLSLLLEIDRYVAMDKQSILNLDLN